MPFLRPHRGQLRSVTCGFAIVIGLLSAAACGQATEAGAGAPASAGCASWPDCDPASESASTAPAGSGDPTAGPPPNSPTGAAPSTSASSPPPTTQAPAPPAPPDVDNVSCLQVVLNANLANQQFVGLPADADLAARTAVADQFDSAATGLETQAGTITDPSIQAKVTDIATEMRSVAAILRSGSPVENTTLITKLTDLQTYCGLA